jgi:hypothetical protein
MRMLDMLSAAAADLLPAGPRTARRACACAGHDLVKVAVAVLLRHVDKRAHLVLHRNATRLSVH